MSRLRVHGFSISIDGFGAGPDQDLQNPLGVGGPELFDWFVRTRTWQRMHGNEGGESGSTTTSRRRGSRASARGSSAGTCSAPCAGRGRTTRWKGWWGDEPPYHVPVFVLTHHPRSPITMKGGTVFRFVTDGIHAALEQAREAAGGKRRAARRRRLHDPAISASRPRRRTPPGRVARPPRDRRASASRARHARARATSAPGTSPERARRRARFSTQAGVTRKSFRHTSCVREGREVLMFNERRDRTVPVVRRERGSRPSRSTHRSFRTRRSARSLITRSPDARSTGGRRVGPDHRVRARRRAVDGAERRPAVHGSAKPSRCRSSARRRRKSTSTGRSSRRGGDPAAQQCGWLKDRFGVSWQVVPRALRDMVGGPRHGKGRAPDDRAHADEEARHRDARGAPTRARSRPSSAEGRGAARREGEGKGTRASRAKIS